MNSSSKIKIILYVLFLISISNHANSAVRYVTPTGAGLMNGTSWTNAFPGKFLQAAVTLSLTSV
ncbi:MAG TPA: hypothetical protein PK536_02260 [Ignavibacteria bacterium]|nr:hypothetical protein [Bacteroidota bacterium]HRI84251.1 hypothetical protein [Ignavibacteria bacterium]HRJ99065.1 hypothetical protein [Ignavibacteria bacterium]